MLLVKNPKNLIGLSALCLLLLSACETIPTPEPTPTVDAPVQEQPAQPFVIPTKADVLFAQTVLRELGYRSGPRDGIWGPRSSTALELFQIENKLPLSDGRLSSQILNTLQDLTAHKRDKFEQLAANLTETEKATQPQFGIASQLAELEPLSTGPQLIITDRPYHIFTKENPYSDVVAIVPKGTGIYIVSEQNNWYKIEATTGHAGYITGQYLSN